MTLNNKQRSLFNKLRFIHKGIEYNLKDLVGPKGRKLVDIIFNIDPDIRIDGSDPGYIKIYRRFRYLARMKLFKLEIRSDHEIQITFDDSNGNDSNTYQAAIYNTSISTGTIKDGEIKDQTTPFVSTGNAPGDMVDKKSENKYLKSGLYVVPTGELLYLFSQVQNSNNLLKSANKESGAWWKRTYNIPQKCSPDRINAIKYLMAIQNRNLFKRDLSCPMCKMNGQQIPGKKIAECKNCGMKWKPPINPELKKELNNVKYNFGEWEQAILEKDLYFDRGPGSQIVNMPCRTRFTDKGRKVHNIKTYDRAWNRANQIFKRGVFVTLTTDPSLHKSLWHANRHLTEAFNKYISKLYARKKKNRRKGYDSETEDHDLIDDGLGRMRYIAAYEFQENGLIHLHLVFFGIRYLAKIDDISDDWMSCGQGRIVHAYGIRRDGDVWMWNKEKPTDTDGRSPVDYLRKYLEKALYVNESFSLYWAVNKRFCTMSRMFQTKECEGCRSVWGSGLRECPNCGGPLIRVSQGYRFLGSLVRDTGPTTAMMRINRGSSPFDSLGVIT